MEWDRLCVIVIIDNMGDKLINPFKSAQRLLTPEEVREAIQSAVKDATLAATLAGHMSQCEKDKAEMKAAQEKMHMENTKKFDLIFKMIWLATGIGTAMTIGGKEVVARFFGG